MKARVRDDVQTKKAVEAARQKAAAALARSSSRPRLHAARRPPGRSQDHRPHRPRRRRSRRRRQPAVDSRRVLAAAGGVSDPIVTDNGAVIVKVLEKKTPTPDELKTGREALKNELLNQQKQRFYASYMTRRASG